MVWQKVLQIFHDLVGAVSVVPSVFFFIPSLIEGEEKKVRHTEMKTELLKTRFLVYADSMFSAHHLHLLFQLHVGFFVGF